MTASLDAGANGLFEVHRIILGANIYGIENLNENIECVPPTGSSIMVMPMKITGGSGGPARVVVMLP
jgi:kynurenine formamidase